MRKNLIHGVFLTLDILMERAFCENNTIQKLTFSMHLCVQLEKINVSFKALCIYGLKNYY